MCKEITLKSFRVQKNVRLDLEINVWTLRLHYGLRDKPGAQSHIFRRDLSCQNQTLAAIQVTEGTVPGHCKTNNQSLRGLITLKKSHAKVVMKISMGPYCISVFQDPISRHLWQIIIFFLSDLSSLCFSSLSLLAFHSLLLLFF